MWKAQGKKIFPREIDVKLAMLTAFWSGFSPSIFPAWLYLPEAHMPLPAEFSGSLKRTSPSTTARWQSIGGDVRGGVVIFSLGVLRQFWFPIWNIYMFIISYFLNEIPSLIRFPSRSMISFKHSPLDDDTDSLIVVCWFSLTNSWNAFC